jgi:hypothetical protein
VLRRLEEGEIDFDRACALVRKATSLASTIHQLLSSIGDRSWSIWTRLERFAETENLKLESIDFSRRHWVLEMHVVMLRQLLDTAFRMKKTTP